MEAQVETLVTEIGKLQSELASNQAGTREKLISKAYKLIAALQLPSEAIQRMGWAEPARLAHCQIGVNLGIFDALAEHFPEAVDVGTIASATKADKILISRLLKHLAATDVIEEVAQDRYRATTFSRSLTEARFRAGIEYVSGVAGPSFHMLPEYLHKTGYDNPSLLSDGPFQFAHQTNSPFFVWLNENPRFHQAFNSYMGAYRAGRPTWADPGFYPVSDLVASFEPTKSSVFLVDVGGGLGHDLEELKNKHPSLPGQLVLQDQEKVIRTISHSKPCTFEAVTHDFFSEQPIKAARAYYLHSVLHDWDDADCVKILSALVPALEPGYSKVLINEIVVPSSNASWSITSMDWLMLALGAMRERTQREWESIVEQAGLRVTKIYTYELGMESLIEAELMHPS